MKTIASALLISLSGKEVTEDGIKVILNSVGAKENITEIKNIVEILKDKKPEDIIAEGINRQLLTNDLASIYNAGKGIEESLNLENINVQVEVDTKVNEIFTKTKIIQKLINKEKQPLELKIYMYKAKDILFSSFLAKIDDSITVKSKVIKKEKAKEKYTDSLSSGNAAIFVSEDPLNDNRIIINMGNISSKSELTFISEFIRFTDYTLNTYEIELLRNTPIFTGRDNYFFQNSIFSGKINICCKNEIGNIKKIINNDYLTVLEEKYLNAEKNEYLISYKIENLESGLKIDYIPSSKIYFEILKEEEKPELFMQESTLIKNEINYILKFKNNIKIKQEENFSTFPALFIFLVDQSGSMSGQSIKIASKALKLFLQSLPIGSFYQIIGFGSEFKKYDKIPKEYTKENIQESLKIIDNLKADLGGTNIFSPLKDIYDSFEIYDKIKISKNIFLLTDGDIENKEETLALIENNNNNFSIYSIGIGNYFDKNLIENAGIIGKGHYNFCSNLLELNKIIVSEINHVTQPYISDINFIISPLDSNNKLKKFIKNYLKENEIIQFNFICDKNEINTGKIKFEMSYFIKDKKYEQYYEIVPYEFSKGEELSKLIIYDSILNISKKDEENLNNALKYQIFYKNTSLYAELEISDKIEEQLKLKIIGNKENNVIEILKKKEPKKKEESKKYYYEEEEEDIGFGDIFGGFGGGYHQKEEKEEDFGFGDIFDGGGSGGGGGYHYKEEEEEDIGIGDIFGGGGGESEYGKKEDNINKNEEKAPNLNDKDYIMTIINTQDFIKGYWEENKKTKIIKDKYDKEFNLLKNKNYSDNVSITILIIFFINKEHPELSDELLMIIKKAKEFIKKSTNISYENIIKEININ